MVTPNRRQGAAHHGVEDHHVGCRLRAPGDSGTMAGRLDLADLLRPGRGSPLGERSLIASRKSSSSSAALRRPSADFFPIQGDRAPRNPGRLTWSALSAGLDMYTPPRADVVGAHTAPGTGPTEVGYLGHRRDELRSSASAIPNCQAIGAVTRPVPPADEAVLLFHRRRHPRPVRGVADRLSRYSSSAGAGSGCGRLGGEGRASRRVPVPAPVSITANAAARQGLDADRAVAAFGHVLLADPHRLGRHRPHLGPLAFVRNVTSCSRWRRRSRTAASSSLGAERRCTEHAAAPTSAPAHQPSPSRGATIDFGDRACEVPRSMPIFSFLPGPRILRIPRACGPRRSTPGSGVSGSPPRRRSTWRWLATRAY